MHGFPEWRRLSLLMELPRWNLALPLIFFRCWRDVVEESQAAFRRLDPCLPSPLRPWITIIQNLPAMKARRLCNSLAAIMNLSTACASFRRLCCRQMKRWWTQIRTAVNNEKVNGTYLDGIPFSNCVRLASSVGAGFRTTTIRQAGPRKRTLESDIVRSLVIWPDDEERPASGSSSSVSRLVEDEAGPASYGTLSSSLWFDANPAVPDLIFPGS